MYELLLALMGGSMEEVNDAILKCNAWGVKWEGISKLGPIKKALANFDILEHCFEVLTM